ncbi:hypothetical protein LCGC14_0363170 [marine sediment metagenome]|uniref:Uncharacterized protein n=1 Tax=marine sediment metagenome TaxID=412755 RepID=A0A0F9VUH2_9ZZZZ
MRPQISSKRDKVRLVEDLNKMHSDASGRGDFQTQQNVENQMQSLGTYPGDPMAKKRNTMFKGGSKFGF